MNGVFVLAGGLPAGLVAGLAVTGALALTGLYLLRRRRTRLVVPFIQLWVPTAANARSDRLARRLRRLLSLALQLAIFFLVLWAAADPRPAASVSGGGRTVVLLIDRSASMRALDEPASRLERAKALARTIVRGLRADDHALVASFAESVTSGTGIEVSRDRLLAAIDAIGTSDKPGELGAALSFAARVLAGRPRPTLILLTDGAGGVDGSGNGGGGDPDTVAGLRGVDVRVGVVGRRGTNLANNPANNLANKLADDLSPHPANNLAILAFSARRQPADPSSIEIALAARNFRATASDVALTIVAGPDRIPVARRRLHLPPGGRVVETLTGIAVPDARLEATLEDAGDDLPLDDRAFAVVPEPVRLRILVAGRRNLYLDGALLGLAATVHVDRVGPDAVEDSRPRWEHYDAVVFDGVTPDPAPEAGRFLYLDPHGRGSPWPQRGEIADPVVTDIAREHPLVRQLGLADLNVTAARRLTLQRGDVALAAALQAPLIVARQRPGLRALALAFDPRRSDLPLRAAFPLLLANALPWLADKQPAEALAWPTGRTIKVDVGDAVAAGDGGGQANVTVTGPDGNSARAPVVSGAVTVALDRAGFYEVVGANGKTIARVAANLASAAESDIAPRPHQRIAGQTVRAPDTSPPTRRRETWSLAVVAALALAALEWFTYHRRLTV